MSKSISTEIQIFAGGLNLTPASHLIKQEEARVSANTNLRKQNLSTLLAPLFVANAQSSFAYYFNGIFRYYNRFRSNNLFNNIWYWTEAGAAGKKYPNGGELPLGIIPPIGRPTIVAQLPTEGEGLEGNINYVYTYYDPDSGSESPPSKPSVTLDLTGANKGQAIKVTGLLPSPDGLQIRLYRIGGIITAYSTVITLEPTVTSYIDQLSFSEIESMILSTLRAYPPPNGLLHLTEHQGRFYGSVNAELFYTPPGKPDSWYALDFISFESVITAVISVANGLIVTTDDKCWLITGIAPIQFVKHLLSESEGCIDIASVAVNEGTAIWLSRSGFIMSNGGKVRNLSLNKIGRFKTMTPLGAAFVDKRYFMSFTGSLEPSNSLFPAEDLYPGVVTNENEAALPPGAVVIDFSFGDPAFTTLIDSSMGQLLTAENELYHISNDTPENVNIVTEDGNYNLITEALDRNLVGSVVDSPSLQKTIKGEELRLLEYLSPVLTDGSIGTAKRYEKIRVTFTGELKIIALDEDSRVFAEMDLVSVRRTSKWVYIPVEFNHGYGIQISIKGRCIVDSIMYTWTPKEIQ